MDQTPLPQFALYDDLCEKKVRPNIRIIDVAELVAFIEICEVHGILEHYIPDWGKRLGLLRCKDSLYDVASHALTRERRTHEFNLLNHPQIQEIREAEQQQPQRIRPPQPTD